MVLAKPSTITPPIVSADAYRHQARRLRARFERDPIALHLSLSQLARRRDATTKALESWKQRPDEPRSVSRTRPVRNTGALAQRVARPPGDGSVAVAARLIAASVPALPSPIHAGTNGFATLVAASLEDGILPYPRRQELLCIAAAEYNLERFDANLIIAAVQHQYPKRERVSRSAVNHSIRINPRRARMWTIVAVFAAVELLVSLGVFWAMWG